jgi:uncharacterized membrane protein YgdD (TMEM256/DUF423 family)
MHLVFDIFQGIGIAAAVGIRPFLPALAVGALAAGDVQIDFKGTDYAFLQGGPFLLAMVVAAIALALAERRLARERLARGPGAAVIAGVALVVGALLFAGSLGRGHYAVWPGFLGGLICAAVSIAATRPLLARVRAKLTAIQAKDEQPAVNLLELYAEGAALALAALSVIAPPVGPIGLALLLWLLLAGRRREDQKYAGLRILR